MTDDQLLSFADRIAPIVASRVVALISSELQPKNAPIPYRLSVEQFAFCLQVCDEVARRYIRNNRHGIVSKKLVSSEAPYKISPEALTLFGVTPQMAAARLAAMVLPELGSALQSPPQPLAKAS